MSHSKNLSAAGVLVALGIVFGDIGTSPLYVLKAIIGENKITSEIVFAGLSFIFWTLTIQTSIKYVWKTLNADNHGEGGIMSLFSLIRRAPRWVKWAAIAGACTLLADGLITPPISISSAVEGVQALPRFANINTTYVAIAIMSVLFFAQQFGTSVVGKAFGPIMIIWFMMLTILGISQIVHHPEILKVINPYYAINFLTKHSKEALVLGGAVFLCTTGAEALYSDLGHCGKGNIRIAWIGVKIALILNYMGQGAWLLKHQGTLLVIKDVNGKVIETLNPFYTIMPNWWLPFGIIIATMATIIASQALISGSYTLVSESIKLRFQPRMKIKYPTTDRGQLYIPAVNAGLWVGCIIVELIFRTSSNMEAAYGLAITSTMIITTTLFLVYSYQKRASKWFLLLWGLVYYSVEGFFLMSNLEKIEHGGWVSLVMAGIFFSTYYVWLNYESYKTKITKNEFVSLERFKEAVRKMTSGYQSDVLVLLSKFEGGKLDSRLLESVQKNRRARTYLILHITESSEPFQDDWQIVSQNEIVHVIDVKRGFKMQSNLGKSFRKFLDESDLSLPSKLNGEKPVFSFLAVENVIMEGPWYTFIAEWMKKILGVYAVKYYFPNADSVETIQKRIHE